MWPLMAGSGWSAFFFKENWEPEDLWRDSFAYKTCPTGKAGLHPVLPLRVSFIYGPDTISETDYFVYSDNEPYADAKHPPG